MAFVPLVTRIRSFFLAQTVGAFNLSDPLKFTATQRLRLINAADISADAEVSADVVYEIFIAVGGTIRFLLTSIA